MNEESDNPSEEHTYTSKESTNTSEELTNQSGGTTNMSEGSTNMSEEPINPSDKTTAYLPDSLHDMINTRKDFFNMIMVKNDRADELRCFTDRMFICYAIVYNAA
jgi:hypothetical protein